MKPAMLLRMEFLRFEEVGRNRIHYTVAQPVLRYCHRFFTFLTTYF